MQHPLFLAFLITGCGSGLGTTPRVPVETNGSTALDINNDGFADLVLVDRDTQRVAVLYGSQSGPSESYDAIPFEVHLAEPAAAYVGDVNGDSFADFVVYDRLGQTPSVHLFFGRRDAIVPAVPSNASVSVNPGVVYTSSSRVSYVGDLTGDGFDELVIWANGHQDPSSSQGSYLSVFEGGTNQLNAPTVFSGANTTLGSSFPAPVAAGDLDGDGFNDLIFPADPTWGTPAVEVRVLYGGSSPSRFRVGTLADTHPNIANATVVQQWSRADLRGDGEPFLVREALVGESATNGAPLSFTAHRADVTDTAAFPLVGTTATRMVINQQPPTRAVGDVNADGYDDVVSIIPGLFSYSVVDELSAIDFDAEDDGARVWYAGKAVWYGQPEGVVPEPLQLQPPPEDLPTGSGFGQAWGAAMLGAGDLNGDGFSDVLVADTFGWNVFYGSNKGLSQTADLRIRPAYGGAVSPWIAASGSR